VSFRVSVVHASGERGREFRCANPSEVRDAAYAIVREHCKGALGTDRLGRPRTDQELIHEIAACRDRAVIYGAPAYMVASYADGTEIQIAHVA
jgi:hypothetical protein